MNNDFETALCELRQARLSHSEQMGRFKKALEDTEKSLEKTREIVDKAKELLYNK